MGMSHPIADSQQLSSEGEQLVQSSISRGCPYGLPIASVPLFCVVLFPLSGAYDAKIFFQRYFFVTAFTCIFKFIVPCVVIVSQSCPCFCRYREFDHQTKGKISKKMTHIKLNKSKSTCWFMVLKHSSSGDQCSDSSPIKDESYACTNTPYQVF